MARIAMFRFTRVMYIMAVPRSDRKATTNRTDLYRGISHAGACGFMMILKCSTKKGAIQSFKLAHKKMGNVNPFSVEQRFARLMSSSTADKRFQTNASTLRAHFTSIAIWIAYRHLFKCTVLTHTHTPDAVLSFRRLAIDDASCVYIRFCTTISTLLFVPRDDWMIQRERQKGKLKKFLIRDEPWEAGVNNEAATGTLPALSMIMIWMFIALTFKAMTCWTIKMKKYKNTFSAVDCFIVNGRVAWLTVVE